MDEFNISKAQRKLRLVPSGALFLISLFVIVVTLLSVWLLDLGRHRTLFTNALLSTSILSAAFLLFIVSGLYKGFKLKDDLGRITHRIRVWELPGIFSRKRKKGRPYHDDNSIPGSVIGGLGEGCGKGCLGELGVILMWILAAIVSVFLLFYLGNFFWALILIFAGMLYWIFFRALRLVFRKSLQCKGQLLKSLGYGLFYTLLYNCWIYLIIVSLHYLIH